jgi:hypothetical protein
VKVGADTLRKATFVAAGLVVATGVPTLVLALGTGGPAHPGAAATSHRAAQPATAAGSSDTSSTTSSTSTTQDAPAESATTGVTSSTAVPTTTAPPPPPCQWSQFSVTVTGTQSAAYTPGQQIQFVVTVENTGPACTDQGQAHCDCWGAYAYPQNGTPSQPVWVWGAPNPPTSSDSVTSPPPVLPPHWSTSLPMTWDQNQCTSSTNCPNSAVGSGSYEIVGLWADHVTPSPIASPPVTVTIQRNLIP